MKCPSCSFVSDDEDIFVEHLAWCKERPLDRWKTFSEYGLEPLNCKTSQIFEIIQGGPDEE